MSLISYAQNFEDIMLWRALGNIKNGFYIDIGANDPEVDSVSKLFYKQGWRGCHIEPSHYFAELLRDARPDETVLETAITDDISNQIDFFDISYGDGGGHTGLSTTQDGIADRHKEAGFVSQTVRVNTQTLDSVLEQYADREIQWMKIDVEGGEKDVISSWKASPVRPRVLVIEATLPNSQEASHSEWETLIINKGYFFVFFDGLNRFYVHENSKELAACLETPANVFDGFALSANSMFLSNFKQQNQQAMLKLKQQIDSLKQQNQQVELKLTENVAILQERQAQLDAVFASNSWKLTTPLRVAGKGVRYTFKKPRLIVRYSLAFAKKVVIKLIRWILQRPRLRQYLNAVLYRFPRLRNRLLKIVYRYGIIHSSSMSLENVAPEGSERAAIINYELSPRAQKIYFGLKSAVEQHKEGK